MVPHDSPVRWTLRQMAEALRAGRINATELVEAHLAAIDQENPRISAFVRVFAEEARAAARNGTPDGPLRGVPLTIKDSFDIAGFPTLCGSRLRLSHLARRDATAVARLRSAGAIFLGKTNCPEMLWNYETDNHVTGRTNHPLNPEWTAGGSSGGESAAISAFCSAGGMGSDGGGSIRVPAHFCGIAGLKPTPGRISGAGHFPEVGYPGGMLGVCGPMARTVDDVRMLFEVVAGPDAEDPFSAPVPLRHFRAAGVRIGVTDHLLSIPVEEIVSDAVHEAAHALRQVGCTVEPFTPRGLDRVIDLWWFFFGQLPAPFVRDLLGDRINEAHWTVTDFLRQGLDREPVTGVEVVERLAQRDSMRRTLLRQMKDYPVLLTPVCGVTAFPHRQREYPTPERDIDLFEAMAPASFVNAMGFPALVVPLPGLRDGKPRGVQLVGRPWEEELLLEIGVKLEQVFQASPPF